MDRIRRTTAARRRALAFSLAEVVVALAVVLILAAVALPSLAGYLDQKTVESTATRLTTVADALTGTSGFFKGVGLNASRLSALSTVIVAKDAGYLDSCGNQFAAKDVTNWEKSGPFVNFVVDRTTGLVTPIGTARDTITRIPFSAATGVLRINFIDGVVLKHAQQLDEVVDAGNGNSAGTVQWLLPAVNGLVVMYYFVPVNNQC